MGVVEICDRFSSKLKMLALIVSYRYMSGAMSGQKGVEGKAEAEDITGEPIHPQPGELDMRVSHA